MESSSGVMMWFDCGFGSGLIVNGRPEGMAISVELVDLGSMLLMGPLYEAPRYR